MPQFKHLKRLFLRSYTQPSVLKKMSSSGKDLGRVIKNAHADEKIDSVSLNSI